MRLLPLILALFFSLLQTCLSQWSFPDELPGWVDLRVCVQNCIYLCSMAGCYCPVASGLGCNTRICVCQDSFRQSALENLNACVKKGCGDTDEPAQAVTLFANFCDGVYLTSVGVVTTGTTVTASSDYPAKTTTAGPTQTAHSTAQRGVALLWGTLVTLMVSLMAATMWGWMAV